jgi:hypothetical protein
MAVLEVRVVFTDGSRNWENVYDIDVGDGTTLPGPVVTAFKDWAIAHLLNIYDLVKIAERPAGSHDEFIEHLFGLVGLRSPGGGLALPLFNTVKLALAGALGRNGVKYLRGMLLAGDIVNNTGLINTAVTGSIQDAFDTFLAALATNSCTLKYAGGTKSVTSGVVSTEDQMRQEHRKRRRSA